MVPELVEGRIFSQHVVSPQRMPIAYSLPVGVASRREGLGENKVEPVKFESKKSLSIDRGECQLSSFY